jgi:2-methylisocitrate lyase-like PEP mutase family enzyme
VVNEGLTFRELHRGPTPLVLPNAWDLGSALALAHAGFTAIGTTSLGVAAAHGLPDAASATRAETMALARHLAALPVLATVDIEAGFDTDPADLAAELSSFGVAGVNVEDGRGTHLADPGEQAAIIIALKRGAPDLFVNARTDTHWLDVDRPSTLSRAHRYVDAGADGVFVPGLTDRREIDRLVTALDSTPLNVLAQLPLDQLKELGVRRVSTGSLLYRAAVGAALEAARRVAAGEHVSTDLTYNDVAALMDDPARFAERPSQASTK